MHSESAAGQSIRYVTIMRWCVYVNAGAQIFLLLVVWPAFPGSNRPALMPGLGEHHHTISTKSPEAQRFFDQGLTLVFAFNHEEAARSFRRAAELDSRSAMAFWGIALALGPCINNVDVDPVHEKAAYEAVQKALLLAPGATERERNYIQTLAKRYSADPKVDLRKLDTEYALAMRELYRNYPDDLDAATLYAESLMDLHPWKLWSLDGHPTENTEEIVAVLESVLRRDPKPPRRKSLLHPCHGSIASSRVGACERTACGNTRAGSRSSCAHACSHLHAHRRLLIGSP
jgi:hypothetical protein